jgi:hexokinase
MDIQLLHDIKNSVVSELVNAKAGKNSSLSFIRHTISRHPLVERGEKFQVLVLGGTVLKSALCKFVEGKLVILDKKVDSAKRLNTKEDFFNCVFEYIYRDTTVLSINFAYPLEPVYLDNILDGILISGTKENNFTDVIGEQIGKLISEEFYRRYDKKLDVTVANDTVCLLLSGVSHYKESSLFGGIVGTGVNFSFFDTSDVINLEAANFDKFPQSPQLYMIDKDSEHPGKGLFEKSVSGAYLYKYYNDAAKEVIGFNEITSTIELSEIAKSGGVLSEIAESIFDKSASLTASFIAGILEYKKSNGVMVMEGSLFWKAHNYKMLVETYLGMLTTYTITFYHKEDTSIYGAAELVQ